MSISSNAVPTNEECPCLKEEKDRPAEMRSGRTVRCDSDDVDRSIVPGGTHFYHYSYLSYLLSLSKYLLTSTTLSARSIHARLSNNAEEVCGSKRVGAS